MGKYIRKTKTAGEVAVMELGVRTRAKTLALQRLQKSPASPATGSAPISAGLTGAGSYLQLRSRRLDKPPISVHHESKRQRQQQQQQSDSRHGSTQNPNPNSTGERNHKCEIVAKEEEISPGDNHDSNAVEVSFGENFLDMDGIERTTRESTPCSLIRDPESVGTPGSTTKPTTSTTDTTNRRVQNPMRPNIPTAHEMDEFFAGAEEEQQRQFVDKYNFDPVVDKPLPGRYEWKKVDP